jgi:signal transduction histidine kinase
MNEEAVWHQSRYLIAGDELDEETILAGKVDNRFLPMHNSNYGFSRNSIWLLIQVTNPGSQTIPWILHFPYAVLDHVKVYYRDDIRGMQHLEGGDAIPDNSNTQLGNGIAFLLNEQPGSHNTYYVHIQSKSSLQLGHYAYSKPAYEKAMLWETLLYGIFYGSLIIMGIYNASIAFSTRSRSYLFYSGILLISVSREAYLAGISYKYFLHNHPLLNEYVGMYSMILTVPLGNAFVINFLNLKERSTVHFRVLQGLSYLALLQAFLYPFFGYFFIVRPLAMQVFLNSVLALALSLIHLKRGYRAARFLVLAWTFILGGFVISSAAVFGALQASWFTKYANPLGQFFEIIFLSFSLSDRINNLRHEKNQAILALNKGLEMEVRAKTKDIQSILDAIPLGIIKVDGKGQLKKGHSKFINRLISSHEISIEGRDIHDILLQGTQLNNEEIAQVMDILAAAAGESELQWSLNADLLPKQLLRNGRTLELSWTPVLDEEQKVIDDYLLVIKDATEQRALEVESERTRKENMIIARLIRTRNKDFQNFASQCRFCLDMMRKVFFRQDARWTQEDVHEVWRHLHTLKGTSRALGFREISSSVHDAESCLHELEGITNPPASLQKFAEIVQLLEDDLVEYLRISHVILRRNTSQALEIAVADIVQLADRLQAILASPLLCKHELQDLVFALRSLYKDPLSRIAFNQIRNLQKIAEAVQKPLPTLVVEDNQYLFDDKIREVLNTVLMHLFRNSLDHGIEKPELRESKGKNPAGSIFLSLQKTGDRILIQYKDDGRGLDLEKIRDKALKAGLIGPSDVLDPQSLANLVFIPGFTTAEKVTEISGRGVGLDAVKAELAKIGGSIVIKLSTDDTSTVPATSAFLVAIELPEFHPILSVEPNVDSRAS